MNAQNIYYNNDFIERQTEGFAFAADKDLTALSLRKPQDKNALPRVRMDIARPVVIADHLEIPDGPDAGHDALTIKNTDSMIVALPECYSFAVPMAKIVCDDLLTLYGEKKFRSQKLSFILQRTDFHPKTAHRANFADWHTHHHGRTPLDLTYQFTSALGTEFMPAGTKDDPFILNAPVNALTRFGGEIPHRSPQNNTEKTMRRSWGAFLVYDRDYPSNYTACNSVLRAKNIERALGNTERHHIYTTPAYDNPIALAQYVNKCVLPNLDDTLTADFPNGLRLGFNSAATGIYKVALSDFDNNVFIQAETFDGQHQKHICPRDNSQIEKALLQLGAYPLEP